MIITLSGANFSSSNIGNLGNSGPFDVTVSCSNVSGASVSLNGGGKSASGTGSAKLTGVPSGTSVTYTISASGYNTASGTINVSFSNVTRSISLTAVGSSGGGNTGGDTPTTNNYDISFDLSTIGYDEYTGDTPYTSGKMSFSTNYWLKATTGVYSLDSYPYNGTMYLLCKIDVRDAVAAGYTKMKVTKTSDLGDITMSSYYAINSNNTNWTGTGDRTKMFEGDVLGEYTIDITSAKAVMIGVRRKYTDTYTDTSKHGKVSYSIGKMMDIKFTK